MAVKTLPPESKGGIEEGVTKTLSEIIAAMLELDAAQRAGAIRMVKELYGRRSRTLHGESLDAETEDRAKVRALCANLLRAVIEWSDFCKRLGDGHDDTDLLFREVEAARIQRKPFLTGADYPIRRLWEGAL